MKTKVFTFIPLLILFSCVSSGQQNDLTFDRYTVEDGLSQSEVLCSMQDSEGYLWFGTGDGLNHFDGYSFKTFRHETDRTSLCNSSVNALYQDTHGSIWVGTANGLDLFIRNQEVFRHHMAGFGINAISEDPQGNIWVGSTKGLWKLSPDGSKLENYHHDDQTPEGLASDLVRCLCFDRSGFLWIGTEGHGLDRFDIRRNTFTHYRHKETEGNTPSSDLITALVEGGNNILWVGTTRGLDSYDRQSGKWQRHLGTNDRHSYYEDFILALALDSAKRLWVGTDEGLSCHALTGTFFGRYYPDPTKDEASSNEITTLLFASDGTLWLGTKNGIWKRSPHSKNFTNYNRTRLLAGNKVRSMLVDPSRRLWAGTDNGLTSVDRTSHRSVHYRHDGSDANSLGDDIVLSLLDDRNGNLWVGTWRTLDRFDKSKGSFTHYRSNPGDLYDLGNSVLAIQERGDGSFWIGSWNNVQLFSPADGKFSDELHLTKRYPDFRFGALHEDAHGTLWIGSLGHGLLRYDNASKQIFQYGTPSEDSGGSGIINAIHESSGGDGLWIGTTEGLQFFDRSQNRFRKQPGEFSLANSFVVGILEDQKGNLWISTNGGISKFNPHLLSVRNYDVTDGLQGNEFYGWSAHYTRNGELFFGGVHGLTSFFPDSLKDNPYVPPVRVTSMKIFSQGQTPSRIVSNFDNVSLSYPENTFSFEFTALDFTQPVKNQYAYMLEGFEKAWVYSGNRRFATYTNLDPGSYTLRVKGSNNDGLWNETGISIPIFISPPFWKTWWFRIGSILLLLVLVSGVFLARIWAVREKNVLLEKAVAVRTAELQRSNLHLESEIVYRKRIEQDLKVYEQQLEYKVEEKTVELSNTVDTLEREVLERKRIEQKLLEYQWHLRSLASELSTTEDRERQRMANYLHDYVGQALAMCKLKVDLLSKGRGSVEEINTLLLQALDHTRSVTFDLSPPVLRELNFTGAIEWLTVQFQHQHHVPIAFESDGQAFNLDEDLKTFLYHAVRELLTNIIKHSQASGASVSLRSLGTTLCIRVEDDGVGPSTSHSGDPNLKGGFGLFNIRERMLYYGGTFEMGPGAGRGTSVLLTIPLSENRLNPNISHI